MRVLVVSAWYCFFTNLLSPNITAMNNLIAGKIAFFGLLLFLSAPVFTQSSSHNNSFYAIDANSNLEITNDLTIEGWIRPDATQANGFATILMKGDYGYAVSLLTDGTLEFWVNGAGGSGPNTTVANAIPMDGSTWTHFAVVVDYGVSVTFYINGANVAASGSGSTYQTPGGDLYIGTQGGCQCNNFSGLIDEVRIWNDVRTAGEISANYTQTVNGASQGLAAYYRFNEGSGTTVFDQVLGAPQSVVINSISWNNANAFQTNSSLAFDGADDYVNIPDTDNSLDLLNEFTIEAWVNVSDQFNNTIIDKGNYNYLFQTHANGAGNTLGFYNNTTEWKYLNSGTININEWTHVAVTFNALSDELKFYINGVLLDVQFGISNPILDNLPVNIGRQDPSSCFCNGFGGKMDELRIWGAELTGTEISSRMNAELTGTEPFLIAYYNFNEGSGSILTDVTSGTNDGTLQNFDLSGSASNWVTDVPFGGAPDITPPTVSITSAASATVTAPISITITFSEAITGLATGDFTLSNASVSNLTTSDNITWTATLTPSSGGAFTAEIQANRVTDLTGNGNVASNQLSRTYQVPAGGSTGPGGVGESNGTSSLKLWLNASVGTNTTTNGAGVTSWNDLSGYGNNLTATTPPTYLASYLNGQPAISFNGSTQFMQNVSMASSAGSTPELFIVTRINTYTAQGILFGTPDNGYHVGTYLAGSGNIGHNTSGGAVLISTPFAIGSSQIVRSYYGMNQGSNVSQLQVSGGTLNNFTLVSANYNATQINKINLGAYSPAGSSHFQHADVAEVIVFDAALKSASRNIITNYLSSKYAIVIPSDLYAGDTPGNGNYDFDVAGIGKESDGVDNQAISKGLGIGDNNYLVDDGDYIFIGTTTVANSFVTTDLPGGYTQRWAKDWYLDKSDVGTNNGSVSLQFDYSDAGLSLPAAGNWALITRAGTSGAYSTVATTSSFTGDQVSFTLDASLLADGYYTIADDYTSNYALAFDGANDYMAIPAMNLNSNTVTMEAWIKPIGTQDDYDAIVISVNGSNYHAGMNFMSGHRLGYHWNGNDASTWNYAGGPVITPNIWQHVAMVIEPTQVTFYLNGVPTVYVNNHIPAPFDAATVIANHGTGGSRFFTGEIDEVRIWNVSRTSEQINAFKDVEITGNEPGLVGYWNFSDGPGDNVVPDVAGNGFIGTMTNMDNATDYVAATHGITAAGTADTTTPSVVSITSGESDPTTNSPFAISITFSEPVYGLTASDFTVTNGVAWNVSTGNNITWTADITPTGVGTVTVDFAAAKVTDLTGNLNTAVTTPFTIEYQLPNYALDFDGANDNVRIPHNSSLNVSGDFTLEAWVYRTADQYGTVFSKWDDDNDHRGYMLNFGEYAANTVSFLATPNGTWDGNQLNWNTGVVVPTNEWHHVALTYTLSGGDNVKLYLDGVLSSQTTWNFAIDSDNPIDLLIGAYDGPGNGQNAGANSRYFLGIVDEVRIWNVARSALEIGDFKDFELSGTEPDLVSYYNFEDVAGTTLTDAAGANDGTLNNFAFSGSTSNWVSTGPTLGEATLDTTPPSIDLLSLLAATSTTLDIDFEISETSTLYYLVINDGGVTPTVASVINSGLYSDEPNLVQEGSLGGVMNGTLNLTGLTLSTPYDIYVVAVDPSGNQSSLGLLNNISTETPNYALDFDGADDYVNLDNTMNTVLAGTNQLTVEAWVYRTVTKTFHTVVGNYATGSLQFLIRLDNDKPSFWVSNTGVPNLSAIGATSVPLNTWTHLAGTYDGSTIRVYVNGILDGSTAMTGPISAGSSSVTIGGNPGAPAGELMQGMIDEVRVWTVARTQQQIANYKNEKLFGSEPGLLAYHDFSAGPNSNITFDTTPNGYNGVLQNMDAASDWMEATYLLNPAGTTDGTAPTPIVSSTTSALVDLSPFSVTITFDEEVVGFDLSDITVINGGASNLQTTNNIVFTADVTPTNVPVTVSVSAAAATDLAGNPNVASNQQVFNLSISSVSLIGLSQVKQLAYIPATNVWEGVVEVTGASFFDFRVNNEVDLDFGDSDPYDGILEVGGTQIWIPSAGVYLIQFGESGLWYGVYQINTLGMLGDALSNGWGGPDSDLTYDGNGIYALNNIALTNGAWKIRANDAWAISWGDNEPDGLLETPGANINATEGTYNLYVDMFNRNYSLTPVPDNALDFDGSDDFVNISTSELPAGNAPRTIEGWVKTNAAVAGNVAGWGASTSTANARWQLLMQANGVLAIIGESNDMTGVTPINDGLWHHVAAVFDGTKASLYVDGQLEVSQSKTYNTGTDVFVMAKRTWANDERFAGQLDNFRVWSDARTELELIQNAGIVLTSGDNLVAAYDFNASSGTTLTDITDGGLNGTLTNFNFSGTSSDWVASTLPSCLQGLTFTAAVDNNWFNAANWCGGVVPDIADPQSNTIIIEAGTISLGAVNALGEFELTNADLIIMPGATLSLNFSGTGMTLAGSARIVNYGTLNLQRSVTFLDNSDILNYGELNIASAIFFSGVNNTLTVPSGAVLRGTNTINGSLVVAIGGIFAPGASPGCTPIAGDYTNAGTLEIELGGLTPCTEYDQVQVTGTAFLGGTLDVLLFGGFTPTNGQEFVILDATTISGTFGTVNLPDANWTIQYEFPAAGMVTVVYNNATPPAAPTDLIAYPISTSQIRLEWSDVADETGYLIERASDFGFTSNVQVVDTRAANVTFYEHNGGANTGYFYRVTATNGAEDASSVSSVEFGSTVSFPAYALDFNGASDFVEIPGNSTLNFTGSFTAEAWVYLPSTTGFRSIVSQWGNPGSQRWEFLVIDGTNAVRFHLSSDGSSDYNITTTSGLTANEWHHVAVVFEAGVSAKIFVDGVEQSVNSAGSLPSSIFSNASLSTIMGRSLHGTNYNDGSIDEVRIWNIVKTDFSDRTTSLMGIEAGLAAYFRMDEGSGVKLVDNSANTNHGDISGATYVPVGTYVLSPPVITSVSPSVGQSGISITINGSGFGSNGAANRVLIGGSEATISAANATQIFATLPDGMKSYADVSVINLETGLQAVLKGGYQVTFSQGDVTGAESYSISNLSLGERAGQDAVVGDFNNDGNLDFIGVHDVNTAATNLVLATGDGLGGFTYSNITATGIYTKHAAVADFNNDGNLDFVVGDRDNSFSIVLGNGNGTFGLAGNYAGYAQHNDVAVGDFDGDGFMDVALSRSTGNVTILLNDGTGDMLSGTNYAMGASCTQLAVADFDADGILDVGAACNSAFTYIPGNGDGSFGSRVTASVAASLTGIVSGDFDDDGFIDVVVLASNTNAQVISMLNDGSGLFDGNISNTPSGIDYPSFGVAGDFNGDGNLDVAFGSNTTHLKIMLGDGSGSFSAVPSIPASSGFMASLDEGDFNNDGKTDIVAANYSNNPGDPTFDVYLYQDAITDFALNFDGGEFVSITHTNDFNFSGGDFTISFWVNPTGANAEIVSKRANASDQGLLIGIFGGNYTIWASGAGGSWNIFNTIPFASVDNNAWTHIAVVKEGGNWNFYKNGNLVNSFAGAGFGDNAEPFSLGRDLAGVGGLVGTMDELQIWNIARSQSTISASYLNALNGTELGLVSYYPFNDGTGSATLTDVTNVPANGALTNFEVNTDWVASGVGINEPLAVAPTAQAYQIEFSNIADNSVDISWTNGNGAARVVLMYQGTSSAPVLTDDFTYGADQEFGFGFNVGGWSVVYNGADTNVSVTGLFSNAEYSVIVYEYNGAPGSEKYLQVGASNNPNTFMTISTGLANPALSFIEGGQSAIISNVGNLFERQTLTVEAWVKPTAGTAFILVSEDAGGWGLYVSGGVLATTNIGNSGNSSNASVPVGVWSHVAITYENGTLRYYLNGQFVEQQAYTLFSGSSNGNYTLGARTTTGQYTLQDIDDLRIWNTVRSDGEILADYDNYLIGNESGLIAYFNMNEGDGLGISDISSSGLLAQLFNGVTWVEGPVLAPPGGDPTQNFFENFNMGLPGSVGTSELSLQSGVWKRQGVQSVDNPSMARGGTGDAAWIQNEFNNHLTTPFLNNANYVTFWHRAHTSGLDGAVFDIYGSSDGGSSFGILLGQVITNDESFVEFMYEFPSPYTGPVRIIYNPSGDAGIIIDDFGSDGTAGGGGGIPEIAVLTPNGGEELQQNNEQYIYWQETNILASTQIIIEYSIDLGNTWNPLTSGTSSFFGGQYMWYTEATAYPIGEYLVRVRTSDNAAIDQSDAPFLIIEEILESQIAIRTVAVAGGAVQPSQQDVLIYKMQLDVSVAPTTTEGILLTLVGDFFPEYFDRFELRINTEADDIGASTLIGNADFPTQQMPDAPDSTMLWFFETTFNPGDLIHLYVVADVAAGAPNGSTFGIMLPSTEQNFGFGGADVIDVGLTAGSVFNVDENAVLVAPTAQAFAIEVTDNQPSTASFSWSNGNGSSRIVAIREGSGGFPVPTDDLAYVAKTTFGQGDEISTGWYTIYNGTGSTATVTGLSPEVSYSVAVLEYNSNVSQQIRYNAATSELNPRTFTSAPLPNVALHFDGVDDHAEVLYDTYLNLGSTFSIEAYVKPGAVNSGFRAIIDKRDAGTNNSNFSMSVVDGTDFGMFIKNGAQEIFQTVPNVLAEGRWNLLTASFDGTTLKMYVDGHLVHTFQSTVTFANLSVPVQIGRSAQNSEFFNGELDEVRIWTNVLKADEVAANTGKELVGDEFGLIAYYNLNDGIPEGTNTSVLTLNNEATVTATRPIDASIKNFGGTGSTSNFVLSNAFDVSVSEPTVQASNIVIDNVTTSSASISWTNGDGARRVVAMKQGTFANVADLSNQEFYMANAAYSVGERTAEQGWYIVYNGTGSSVNVTGLASGATYTIAVMEANGPANYERYNLNTAVDNPAPVTVGVPTPDVTFQTLAVSAANLRQGKNNNLIYKFKMNVSGGAIQLNEITLPMGGTATQNEFGLNAFKLYHSIGQDNFNVASTPSIGAAGYNAGLPTWTVNKTYQNGDVYFYVTADIAAVALPDEIFFVQPSLGAINVTNPRNLIDGGFGNGSTFTIEQTPTITFAGSPTFGILNEIAPGSVDNPVYRFNMRIDTDVRITALRLPWDGSLLATDVAAVRLLVGLDETDQTHPNQGNFLVASGTAGVSEFIFQFDRTFAGPEMSADTLLQFWVDVDLASTAVVNRTFTGIPTNTSVSFSDIVNLSGSIGQGQTITVLIPDPYCDPDAAFVPATVGPRIDNVIIANVNNTTTGGNDIYYNNYSDKIAGVIANTTVPISITGNSSGSGFVKVWVDWNKDLVFDESTELVINNAAYTGTQTLNLNINVPATATIGTTRMRIYTYTTGERLGGACSGGTPSSIFGQVEDYGLSILEPSGSTLTVSASDVGYFSFKANWVAQPGANFYRVDIAEDENFSKMLVNNAAATTTEYAMNTQLEYDKDYFYRVRVAYPSGISANSNVTKVRTLRDQYTAQDSVALVLIYDTNGGNGWANRDGWKASGRRLKTWAGVTMTGTRVSGLDLSGKGLTGEVPTQFVHLNALNQLTTLDVSGNELFGLGALGSLAGLTTLDASDNYLVFNDLESIVGTIDNFNYSPQKQVGESTRVVVPRGSNYTVQFTQQSADTYQWNKDGVPIDGAFGTSYEVLDIRFETMGDFTLSMTDADVPGLTLESADQTVLASGGIEINVRDLNGLPLDEGIGYLLKIEEPGQPFDTTVVAPFTEGDLLFDVTILGDYIITVEADPLIYLPTYFVETFLWEEADTLFFRDVTIRSTMNMTVIPGERDPADVGRIGGTLWIDVDDNARLEARRRAANVRAHVRRRTTGGRELEDPQYVLIASVLTNENGEFDIPNLPPGFYRINFEYPGIPMDQNSFVEFEIGADGDNSVVQLAADITEDGIYVEQVLPLPVGEVIRDMKVYPNPATSILKIGYEGLEAQSVRLVMYDLSGRIVKDQSLPRAAANTVEMRVEDLKAGLYFLNVVDTVKGQVITTFKVVVKK